MSCQNCARRRLALRMWLNRWLPRRWKWMQVRPQDANTQHLKILAKLGLSGEGPAAGDEVEKKTILYQQIATWTIEYDAKTNRAIAARVRVDEYEL